jgi:predicted membrane GTPase involved in stress response
VPRGPWPSAATAGHLVGLGQSLRCRGDSEGIQLEAPLRMTLERAIEYIDIDEYVEATPKSLRLRKRILDATARKRAIVIAA